MVRFQNNVSHFHNAHPQRKKENRKEHVSIFCASSYFTNQMKMCQIAVLLSDIKSRLLSHANLYEIFCIVLMMLFWKAISQQYCLR